MNPKQKLGVGTLILGCSRVDHRVGLQLADGAFRVFFCVGAFASLDAVVEFGADHDVDFFCFIDGLDGHDFTYGLFPFSLSVEVGVGLDGADDGVGSDFGDGGALDDVFECGTEFLGANFVEAKGASVTVEDGAVADAESFDDGAGMAPDRRSRLRFLRTGGDCRWCIGVRELPGRGWADLLVRVLPWDFSFFVAGLRSGALTGVSCFGIFGAGARRRWSGMSGHVGRLLICGHTSRVSE